MMNQTPTTAQRFATAADGTRLHYRLEGPADAPVVMFSHSLGVSLDTWDAQAAFLADRYRVLRYDTRGHGASEAPAGEYDIGLLARDALAVLDDAGIEQAHLIGLSMGGMVGMWIALHQPQRLRRLVLANTTAHIPLRDMWNDRIATALSQGMDTIAAPTLRRWFGPAFQASAPEQVSAAIEHMRTMSPVGYAGCCAALREADQRADLGRIATPTLVVTGAADSATSPAVAESLRAAIPGAAVAIIEGAGHLSNLEQPDTFNRIIGAFLDSQA